MLYLGWEGGKTANTLLCKGCINDAITVRQPYASLLVNGEKAFEYRSRKLPESLRDKIIFIHAGKQSKKEKVNIKRLRLLTSIFLLLVSAFVILLPYAAQEKTFLYLLIAGFWCALVVFLILANTWCKKK